MHILDLKAQKRVMIAAAAAAALVSCSGGGGDGGQGAGGGAPPAPPPVPFPGQLGIGFSVTFGAAAIAEPRDPQAGDVIPISLSAEPIDVPDPM